MAQTFPTVRCDHDDARTPALRKLTNRFIDDPVFNGDLDVRDAPDVATNPALEFLYRRRAIQSKSLKIA